MLCDEIGLALGDNGELLFQRSRDLAVILAAPAQQERLIGRILDQRVTERVKALFCRANRKHDLRGDQPLQTPIDHVLGLANDSAQQRAAEFAADDRAELGDFLCVAAEPVEPRQERRLQSLGNVGIAAGPGFNDRLRQFLDVERHPVGAPQDACDDLLRQSPAARRPHHLRALPAAQPAQGQSRHLWMPRPIGLEFGAVGDQQQNPGVGKPAQSLRNQIARCWIESVRVLEDVEHRFLGCQAEQLVDQSPERAFAALLGGQVERPVALDSRQ